MSNNNNINNIITNQENDTNFNLVNTNNNVNNQNIEETNRNDSNLKPPIYWNDQNEEAFLQEIELQNLFANTLLHDDFNNDETDFNCLGIDNLQLNYTNESSNDQQPIQTSTTTPTNSLNDTNVLSSLSLISLNNSATPVDHQLSQNQNEFILHSDTTFNNFNSIDVSNLINQPSPSETTILDLNTLQILDSTVTVATPTSAITNSSSSSSTLSSTTTISTSFKQDLINTSNESIQASTLINQDDSLFKKPNLFESFFTVTPIINNNNNTNSTVNSSRNSSSSSTTSTIRRSTNLPNDLTKFNTKPKLKQQQKQQIVNLLEPIDLITQLKKMNNFKEDSTKLKSKDDESKSEFDLSFSRNDNAFTSNSNSLIGSSPSFKLFTLKRSRKRSKLITNNSGSKSSQTSNISTQDTNSTVALTSNHQTKTNIKLTKSTKTNKKEKKEKLKQIKLNTVNLEPLNKKLAVDKSNGETNNCTNSSLIKLKKEDVELHIKELSLLDLHSSEDDSSELLIKNALNSNLKKNVRSSSNENNTSINNNSLTANTTIVKNSNYLNEILSKRIKYSPVLNSSSNLNKPDQVVETQSITSSVNTIQQDLNNNTNKKERKIDKLIQYLTKSSLDSNGNSVSSSTSSSESLQLIKKLNNQEINDNHSPPTISQNKRKKNEIDLISLPITINENVIHSANSDESSKSIDNDTLQHMKNLDLNLDLLPNETTFKKNKHSVIREELVVEQKQKSQQESTNLTIDLKDVNSRKMLWNLLKKNSSQEEMIEEFGVELHDKISFWDLVKLKLKFSKNSQLKTTYDIIDDYTVLYSNMSDLLESFVEEHSSTKSISFKKNENSSRSRSSSRNCRKQSSTAPLHRI